MRIRRARLGGVLASLILTLGLAACSGQQQEDGEALEATDDQAQNNNEGEASEQGAEDQSGQEGQDAGGEAVEEGGGNAAASGNATENDLQEIITEMNGQGASGDAAANAPALPQDGGTPPPAAEQATAAAPTDGGTPPPPAAEPAPAAPQEASNPHPAAIPFQPGGTPAGPGLPELGSKMAYIVQKGDTLAKISQKIYGSNGRWQELAKLSGLQNPNRVYPGDVIYYALDEGAIAFATAYEKVQRSEEVVKAGDTLATIAKRVYGSSTAWRSIWRQNDKIDNPDIVPPGTTVFYITDGALKVALNKAKSSMATKVAKNEKTFNKTKSTVKSQQISTDKGSTTDAQGLAVETLIIKSGNQIATNKINGSLGHDFDVSMPKFA